VHSKNTNDTEEFRLQDNIPRTFDGSPSPVDNDMEAGRGTVQASDASTKALNQENGWDMTKQSTTDESSDEIRRFHGSGGVTIVHTEI
jgi:hypothetical protein